MAIPLESWFHLRMKKAGQRDKQLEVQLLVTGRAVRRAYNSRLKKLGLSMTESGLLQFIELEGAMTQSQLAGKLHIGRMATGTIIDGLVKRDLLKRERSPRDGRVWLVSATRSGIEMAKACKATNMQVLRELRSGLTSEETAALFAMLETIRSNSENMAD